VAFVIGLDKPVRQGNTAYNFLCAQFDMNRVEDNLEIRLPEESMYDTSGLERNESGKPLADILQRLLKHFANVNVQFACLDFKATNGKNCVRCSHRATEGHLYCLKRAFLFITKPVVYIKYDDVVAVEFSRAESWVTQTRFFDLKVYKKGENQPYDFQQIDRNEYQPLIDFLQSAGIRIRNLEKSGGAGAEKDETQQTTLLGEEFDEDEDEDSDYVSDDDDDDESDDEDDDDDEDESEKKKKKKSSDDDERREKKSKKEKKKDKKHKKDKKEKKRKRSSSNRSD
jgi:structure-specific recognition protein 1